MKVDPIALILVALTSGVAIGARDTASEAIRDAYSSLKELLKRKFVGRVDYELRLSEFEKDPGTWTASLREALTHMAADQDKEIVKAARDLLSLSKQTPNVVSRYNLKIDGDAKGIIQSENSVVNVVFNDRSGEG